MMRDVERPEARCGFLFQGTLSGPACELPIGHSGPHKVTRLKPVTEADVAAMQRPDLAAEVADALTPRSLR